MAPTQKKSTLALRASETITDKPKPYDRSNNGPETKEEKRAFESLSQEEQAVLAFFSATYNHHFLSIMEARRLSSKPSDDFLSNIKKICKRARKREEVDPLPDDERIWGRFIACKDFLHSLVVYPEATDLDAWVGKGVLSREGVPGAGKRGGKKGKKIQQIYIRRRLLSKDVFLTTLKQYILSYPVDAGWACARLASEGFGELAEETINSVFKVFGYTLRVQINRIDVPERDWYADTYPGITVAELAARLDRDENPTRKTTCRHQHYSSISPGCEEKWEIFAILPLSQEMNSSTDFRNDAYLSYPEAILCDLLPGSSTSARGGFAPFTRPPPQILNACNTLMVASPDPTRSEPATSMREEAGEFYNDLRAFFDEMRCAGHQVGPPIAAAAFEDVRGRLVDHINTVNGRCVSLTIMKDLTAEVHKAQVNGLMFSEPSEAGRALAIHADMVNELLIAYYEDRMDIDEDLRDFLGPYVDFWALILIHRWFGLLLVILGRLIQILDPLIIHSWSSNLSSIFRRTDLIEISRETQNTPISLQLLEHHRINEMQYSQKDKEFLWNAGKVMKSRTGTGENDIALVLPAVDPGHQGYRPALRLTRQRFHFIVCSMSLALNRIAAAVASQEAASTPKLLLLDRIEREFENLCVQSGVKDALEKARDDVMTMERGHAALLGRFVSGDVLVTKQGSRKERKKMGDRNCGPRAIGVAGSEEREAQLIQWRRDAEERVQWKLEPTYIAPKDLLIETEEYKTWFMGVVEGKSFLYSANAMANANPFDVGSHSANQAAARRVKETEGQSWEKAEFERAIPDVALALTKPQKKWEESPAWVRCSRPGCGGVFLSKDRNAKHRCQPSQLGTVTMVTKQPDFAFSYLRLLYPHDLVGYPGVSHLVTTAVMEQYEWISAPASRFLVDGKGNILPEVPKGIEPRLVKGMIWYREKKGRFAATSPRFRFAMAVDVAVREASEGAFGPTPYAAFATQPWEPTDPRISGISRSTTVANVSKALRQHPDSVKVTICKVCGGQVNVKCNLEYQHTSCGTPPNFTMKNASQDRDNFHEYRPKRFIDLPYANMRSYVYLALALDNDQFLPLLAWEK